VPTVDETHRGIGVRVLRLINTAEHRYLAEKGKYAPLQEALTDGRVEDILRMLPAKRLGINAGLWSLIETANAEIVPGWKLEFAIAKNRESYAVTLIDLTGKTIGFATDHTAVIQQMNSSEGGALTPIGTPSKSKRDVVRRLAAFSLEGGGDCCGDHLCCCAVSGCKDSNTGSCANCGCELCTWCCA
jgi:hypothetical protein